MLVGKRDYLPRLQTLLAFLILSGMAKTKLAIWSFLCCGEFVKSSIYLIRLDEFSKKFLYRLFRFGSRTGARSGGRGSGTDSCRLCAPWRAATTSHPWAACPGRTPTLQSHTHRYLCVRVYVCVCVCVSSYKNKGLCVPNFKSDRSLCHPRVCMCVGIYSRFIFRK